MRETGEQGYRGISWLLGDSRNFEDGCGSRAQCELVVRLESLSNCSGHINSIYL